VNLHLETVDMGIKFLRSPGNQGYSRITYPFQRGVYDDAANGPTDSRWAKILRPRSRICAVGIILALLAFGLVTTSTYLMRPATKTRVVALARPHPHPLTAIGPPALHAGEVLGPDGLVSPNGRYQFSIEDSGDLSLKDVFANRTLFSTDTAMYLDVSWQSMLRPDGVLELSWDHPEEEPSHQVVWHTNLRSDCRSGAEGGDLTLHDNGLLQITAGGEVLCTINRPVEDKGSPRHKAYHETIALKLMILPFRSTCDYVLRVPAHLPPNLQHPYGANH
jgi:hypothetical protein